MRGLGLSVGPRPLRLGLRRSIGFTITGPSSATSAIRAQVAQARAIVSRLPVRQVYPPAFAKYFYLIVAATYGEVIKLLGNLHRVGENEDFGDHLTALTRKLHDLWDELGPAYRLRINAALAAGAASVDLGDDGFKQDLYARLDLLDQGAGALTVVQSWWPQSGEGLVYNFLDATNRFLRGVGEATVNVMENAAKIPGRVGRSALSSLPWGWMALAFGAFIAGRWLLDATGKGGRYRPALAG